MVNRCVLLYISPLGQSALAHRIPVQAMKDWDAERPDLFHKKARILAASGVPQITEKNALEPLNAFRVGL